MNGKLKAVFLLTIMYGLGAISGAAWQTYRIHHLANPHAVYAERRIKKLEAQLNLSPAQEQALRNIFQKAHDRATEINEEVSWDLADIHRDSVQAIREVLTPDQMKQFEKLHKKAHDKNKHLPGDEDPDDSSDAHSEVNS
jgi:Spy/CpxP family protein refolding chaperone